MAADRFKKNWFKVMDGLSLNPESVLITKQGKPIAKLPFPDARTTDDFFGFLRGRMKIVGDIVGPAVPIEDWEVLRN